MTKEELALGMVCLKHAMDRIRPAQDELRLRARELLATKERIPALVDGEVVGTIGKSSPKRVARFTAVYEFVWWMEKHYPEHVENAPYVEDMTSAVKVLEEHAPHLVHYRKQVREEISRDVLHMSAQAGIPTGPGGEVGVLGVAVETPEGNVTVLPERGMEHLVEQLFAQGRVSLDGTVRKEIEA